MLPSFLTPHSFATRLTAAIILASVVAVSLACGLLVPIHHHRARTLALDNLLTLGEVISTHSAAALAFEDPQTGRETLEALRTVPEVAAAALFDAQGQPFAAYARADANPPELHARATPRLHDGWMIHVEPVVQDRTRLGTLAVAYDVSAITRRLWRDVLMAALAAAAGMGVATLLALRLRAGLAEPVAELARVAEAVAEEDNYSVRARRFDDDELGRLTDTFNSMLQRIEAQNREIHHSNAELHARNQEMEQFVYTVSHDLKSPLVTITGFVGLLQEDIRQGNMEGILDAADHLRRASTKMGELIEDLLNLSRIGRVLSDYERVDVNALVDEVIEDLRTRLEERRIEVAVQPRLPLAWGDRMRLMQVFDNLLNNAVKYGCPPPAEGLEPACRIEVGGERRDDEVRYFVRDFGPGIEPQYHGRIWGLFQRLDSRTEGTGMGLAIVARIAEVHGGRVWLESEPGRGATFWLALPTTPDTPPPAADASSKGRATWKVD